jgi:hypothetical protein
MKIAFYISSVINLDNTNGFGHNPIRSAFPPAERFRQTQFTIANIKSLFPDARIFLFEIGHNVDQIRADLKYVHNLTVISAEELDSVVTELCRTNESKGTCETAATLLFLKNYIDVLKEYDYVIKISGRYFFTSIDKSILNQENTNKYICKQIQDWEWKSHWGYPEILKKDNRLFWAPSQSYAVGKDLLDDLQQSLYKIYEYYINNPELAKILDFECLLYQYVLQDKPYIEVPWIAGGWSGQTGVYNEY